MGSGERPQRKIIEGLYCCEFPTVQGNSQKWLDGRFWSGKVEPVSSHKILCALSLVSVIGVATALVVTSEVRASNVRELADAVPLEGAVTAETLTEAAAFVGEFKHVGGQKDSEQIDAAIETAVAAVSPLVRGIGRKRLQETNQIPGSVELKLDGEQLGVVQGGEQHEAALDGKKVTSKNQFGDKVKVSHELRGGKLVQTIEGEGGKRINRYKLSSDGKRMTMSVEISSPHLPVSVTYSLSYERR